MAGGPEARPKSCEVLDFLTDAVFRSVGTPTPHRRAANLVVMPLHRLEAGSVAFRRCPYHDGSPSGVC